MSTEKSKKKPAAKKAYLTKRILVSASTRAVKKAAAETLKIKGYLLVAENDWLVKKYADGREEKISRLEKAHWPAKLNLD